MAEPTEIEKMLNDFGTDVVERAMRNLGATRTVNGRKRRAVASGRLKDSLTYKLRIRYNKPTIDFTTNSTETQQYADIVEFGRKPGSKQPPVEPIIRWMKTKPVKLRAKGGGFVKQTEEGLRRAAWAISASIGRRGIPPLRYYRDAIEDALDQRGQDFLDALQKELETRLLLNQR